MKINSKKGKTNYLNQKGITLIALVVTIVVLLILAGVSINTLFGDNGIIKKAQDAQNRMNNAQESDLNALNELDEFIYDATGKLPSTEDTTPYYPDGTFSKVSRTNLSNGLVIQDANKNEYVWIEVPKSLYENSSYNTKTTTADQKPANSEDYGKIEYCLHKYTETYRNGTSFSDTYYSDEMTGLTKIKYNELKQKMLKSVYENGGFWIGRYEAGIAGNRTSGNIDLETAPAPLSTSKTGTEENPVYPYTYVTCSQAQTLASKLSTGKGYTSSLMFGVQWDLILKHIETKEVKKGTTLETIQSALKDDSSSWGNYYNASFEINRGKYAKFGAISTWYNYNNENGLENCVTYANGTSTKVQATSKSSAILLTTGASDTCKKMNIYDLAGNVKEWTLERYSGRTSRCADRGGCYASSSSYSVSGHTYMDDTSGTPNLGFRLSLYK
jgi:type II secretory pathway pseudopilin PulG